MSNPCAITSLPTPLFNMYVSSLFGWLRFLEDRIEPLRNESPVSKSPRTEPRTEACRMGLLELTELLEPLLGWIAGDPPSGDEEAVASVLDELYEEGVVRLEALSSELREQVERSPRFDVHEGFVLVPVDRVENSANIQPVVTRIAGAIENLIERIKDILQFLRADDMPESRSLLIRWRQIGGLLSDFHGGCVRLLRRGYKQGQISGSVNTYTARTERIANDGVRFIDD